MAWQQGLSARERTWYRWAPLIAGISLLTLLGAGREHVDVLGHGLGFLFGVGFGWALARAKIAKRRDRRMQIVAGAGSVMLIFIAWFAALRA
jgi:hypothetical protein